MPGPYEERFCSFAARVASSSQRLLSAWVAWPLVQTQVVLWRADLLVEFLPEVLVHHRLLGGGHPPFALPAVNPLVMPFFTYSESVTTSTSQSSRSALSPSMAARNSMRLLVVCGSRAPHLLLVLVVAQNGGPAAGAGVAQAGAIGDELDFFH